MMTARTTLTLTALAITRLCAAELDPVEAENAHKQAVRERNRAVVLEAHRQDTERYRGNTNMFLRPGLVADRAARRVDIHVEMAGIRKGDPVEFCLIAEQSAHDYEALAVSFASPTDVRAAIEFIGLTPGRPVDYDALQFWPRGERCVVSLLGACGSNTPPVRLEQLMWDDSSGHPLPAAGYVFTGSTYVAVPGQPGQTDLATEVNGPHALIANYNEPGALFDVPRRASQGEVYETQLANPAFIRPRGQMARMRFEPEYPPGRVRVLDLVLHVSPAKGTPGTTLANLAFRIETAGAAADTGPLDINATLKHFTEQVVAGRDPFVTLDLDDGVTLGALQALAGIVNSIESERGIRVEPPQPGQLYYKAFMPNPAFRDRTMRLAQPWELRLVRQAGAVTGTLTHLEETWPDGADKPDLHVTDIPVPTPAALRQALDEKGPGLPVILVFAPAGLTHAELMAYLAPALPTHPTIHVYVD